MKRRWLGVAALVAGACAISVVGARRIEAQYSSPVKVVNSTSAPAIASLMDNPGRIAYQSYFPGGSTQVGNDYFFDFPMVPTGHRLVIQQVSGFASFTGNPNYVNVAIYSSSGHVQGAFTLVTPPNGVAFAAPITAYVDAGEVPEVRINAGGTTYIGTARPLTLTGYLLDCTAAPCAAIAH